MRFVFSIIILIALSAKMVDAQPNRRFGVKTNISSTLTVKSFNLIPEFAITERLSAQVGFYRTNNFTYKEHVFSGTAITPEVRFHLKPTYLKGLYAAPFVRYRKLAWDIPSEDAGADFISIGGGVCVGYQSLIKNRVILDLYIGPGFSGHDIKIRSGVADDFKLPITSSVGVRAGIALGIAF